MNIAETVEAIQRHIAQGDAKSAEMHLRELVEAAPSSEGFKNLAILRLQLGRLTDALEACERAIARSPHDPSALGLKGDILCHLGRDHEGIDAYQDAIRNAADFVQAWINLAKAYTRIKNDAGAIAAWRSVQSLEPLNPLSWRHLGALLANSGHSDAAREVLEQAVALAPKDAEARASLGAVLIRSGTPEAALSHLAQAIRLEPNQAPHRYHMGLALAKLGRDQDAISAYRKTLELDANHLDARWNLGLLLLRHERWTEAWPLWETRLDRLGLRKPFPEIAAIPRWDGRAGSGSEPLLVTSEQGLGDTLMFCRFAESVAALGYKVHLLAQKPLRTLLRNTPGIDRVLEDEEWHPTDYRNRIELLSLPAILTTQPESVPFRSIPYIFATRRTKLEDEGRLKIGLVWRGQQNLSLANRSIPLALLLAHLPNQHRYFSLQKTLVQQENGLAREFGLQFEETELDFEATASLAAAMDAVVTIDTSVAHLVGAMGTKTAVLLPHDPDWRWGHNSQTSRWYSCVRLFRASENGRWESALKHLPEFFEE